jgi:hypothetical protein
LLHVARIPDPRFSHETEAGLVDVPRPLALSVCLEEDGRPEDRLERFDQSLVLGSPLLHAEDVEHLSGACEGDRVALLADSQSGEKDRDEPMLSPRQAVLWVPGRLENELPVTSFVQQRSLRRTPHGKTTENEWSGSEAQILSSRLRGSP